MRDQINDLNKASILNDIGSLFKMGVRIATPYMKNAIYKGIASRKPKFNYGGSSYEGLMGHLTGKTLFGIGLLNAMMGL